MKYLNGARYLQYLPPMDLKWGRDATLCADSNPPGDVLPWGSAARTGLCILVALAIRVLPLRSPSSAKVQGSWSPRRAWSGAANVRPGLASLSTCDALGPNSAPGTLFPSSPLQQFGGGRKIKMGLFTDHVLNACWIWAVSFGAWGRRCHLRSE